MEAAMATEAEQLNVIKARLADVHNDVQAKLEQVRAEVSPQGQAALDEVVAAIQSFDDEIGDADGSDTQVPPTDGGGEGGENGPAGGDSANVPA
jgi:hypothetical protein